MSTNGYAKPVAFDEWERPLCPNSCGVMDMTPLTPRPGDVAREAFARCPKCTHQMIVGDERPVIYAADDLAAELPASPNGLPDWQRRAIEGLKVRY